MAPDHRIQKNVYYVLDTKNANVDIQFLNSYIPNWFWIKEAQNMIKSEQRLGISKNSGGLTIVMMKPAALVKETLRPVNIKEFIKIYQGFSL